MSRAGHGWTSFRSLRALHGLNRRLSRVNIMTYDQLLAQGERIVSVLSTPMEDQSVDVEYLAWMTTYPGE